MPDTSRVNRRISHHVNSTGVPKDNLKMRKEDANHDGYVDFMEYFEANKPKENLSDEEMYNYMQDLNVEFTKKSAGKDKIDLQLQSLNSDNKIPAALKKSVALFVNKIESKMKFPAYVAENGALKLDENRNPIPAVDKSGKPVYVEFDVLSTEEKEILEKIKSFGYSDGLQMNKDMIRLSESVAQKTKDILQNNVFTYDIKTDTQGTCAPLENN